jgi:phosphatidyl-myo-inositol dimannoside synthase
LRAKVALFTSGLGTRHGGVGVVAQHIVSALQDDTDIAVWEHPPSLPRFLRFAIVGIRTYLAGLKRPDFVFYDHVHLAALHATIPSLREIPYGVFLHGIEVWVPLLGRRQEALLGANVLIVNSATTELMAREVNPWLPKAKIVWLGVPGHDRPADVASSRPIGLIVGRMASAERLKGHDSVMDAWPEICAEVPDAKLVIVGTGDDERRLRNRATQEKLDGVEFRGYISDESRDRVYQSSRMLFYPSNQEGFGLAAAEAASFGLPVLGLAKTVTEELFPPGTGAILAQSLSTPDIVKAVAPLLKDPARAAEMGIAAWTRVQNNFLEHHFRTRFRKALDDFIPYHETFKSSL